MNHEGETEHINKTIAKLEAEEKLALLYYGERGLCP